MKSTKQILFVFSLLIVAGALYRLMPGRPMNFAPQIAMAIFGGAVIKDKKWAFALPLFSMFLSDALFQVLNNAGILHNMPGFYEGQWVNYILLAGLSFFGIMMKKISLLNIAKAAVAAPLVYFILSNGATWLGGGGFGRPRSFSGFVMAMQDGLPFLQNSMVSTAVFSAVFFGFYGVAAQRNSISGQQLVAA